MLQNFSSKFVSFILAVSLLFSAVPLSSLESKSGIIKASQEEETKEDTNEDESEDSNEDTTQDDVELEEPDKAILESPADFEATKLDNDITLKWSKVHGATGYYIYRHVLGKDGYSLLKKLGADVLRYKDENLTRMKSYQYQVVAVSDDEECNSEPASLTEAIAISMKKPYGLGADVKGFYLTLSWKGHKEDVFYEVYRSQKKSGTYKLITKTTKNSYTDKKLKPSTTYYYKIKARNSKKSVLYRSDFSKVLKTKSSELDPKKPMVALTYDDGPSKNTAVILKSLKKYHGKATFFVVGNRVSANKKNLKKAYEYGCEIGNHSWNHANLGTSSAKTIRSQISRTDTAIKRVIGVKPTLIRPPYGSIGTTLKNEADKPLILWSIDTLDWKTRNANSVYNEVVGKVKDGDIILMHDLYDSTAEASKRIMKALSEQGYQMVTVSELALCKKQKLRAGEKYCKFK